MTKTDMYKNIVGWEKIISKPSPSYQAWFDAEKELIVSSIKRNSFVLEVGCGDGRSMKDVLNVTDNIVGVDHDETAVEHARISFGGHPTIKIILAEGIKLPFQDETFDYVTCIGTFANLGKDRYLILAEMARVLKEKGRIIISSYAEGALPERLKAYKEVGVPVKGIDEHGTVTFDDAGKEGISEQFSREELTKIFEKASLVVENIQKAGIGYVCLVSKK